MLQGQGNGAKSDVVPGNPNFGKELGFKRFLAGVKIGIEQPCTVKDVYLADGGYVDKGEHLPDFDPCAGFFQCFPRGCLGGGFLCFHETGGERPFAMPGFDGPSAQQDAIFPFRNGSNDQLGVPVVDSAAVRADMTKPGIAGGDGQGDDCAALGAVIHGGFGGLHTLQWYGVEGT